jgi:flagellar basal body P-ring formation protein FlgA
VAKAPNKAAFAHLLGTCAAGAIPRIGRVNRASVRLVVRAAPLLAAALWCACALAAADGGTRAVLEGFLREQAAGSGAQVAAQVDDSAARSLPACAAPQPFLPAGASAWGAVLVGVRCPGPHPWARYVQAHVQVRGAYLVAAHALAPGHVLAAGDVEQRTGDLTRLPRNIVAGAAQPLGMVVANAVAAGAPLRGDALRGEIVVRPGEPLQVQLVGEGFAASIEARALTAAAAGAPLQVRTAEGRVLAATAVRAGFATVGAAPPATMP